MIQCLHSPSANEVQTCADEAACGMQPTFGVVARIVCDVRRFWRCASAGTCRIQSHGVA